MRHSTQHVLIGCAIAAGVAAVGRLAGEDAAWWTLGLLGLVLAGCLWIMLLAGGVGRGRSSNVVTPRAYALAGAAGLLLGPVLLGSITGDRVYWVAGFIVAGLFLPSWNVEGERA